MNGILHSERWACLFQVAVLKADTERFSRLAQVARVRVD